MNVFLILILNTIIILLYYYSMRCARKAATCLNLGQAGHEELKERLQKNFQNEVQNRPRNHENSGPRGCPGALWRPPGWSWGLWGRFLRFLARFGGDFWRRWSQDGRKMGQVGSKLRPRWAMMAPRWPSWAQFGSFLGSPGTTCGHFFCDLCKNGRSVKTNNTTALWVVFWGSGLPLEGPGGCLGSVLGAMLEDGGSKMVLSWLS